MSQIDSLSFYRVQEWPVWLELMLLERPARFPCSRAGAATAQRGFVELGWSSCGKRPGFLVSQGHGGARGPVTFALRDGRAGSTRRSGPVWAPALGLAARRQLAYRCCMVHPVWARRTAQSVARYQRTILRATQVAHSRCESHLVS